MKHSIKALLLASLAVLSASCAPSSPVVAPVLRPCPACTGEEATTPPLPGTDLLPARFIELSPFIAGSTTLTKTEPHIRGGAGFEIAIPFGKSGSFRWQISEALTAGAWGDQHHGKAISETSTGLRVSLLPSSVQVLDFYVRGSEGFVAGWGALPPGAPVQIGNLFGGGVGLRLFRAFAVELTGHWLHSFGNPFTAVNDGSTTADIPDGGISLGIDLCAFGAFCDSKPKAQGSEDATCMIYKAAGDVCEAARQDKSSPDARKELCRHAFSALSIQPSASVLARQAVQTFLGELEKSESGTSRASVVGKLSEANRCLERWRACGRREECTLSQRGQIVETRRVYAPFAIEVLAALGCGSDGAPAEGPCKDVCEDPQPAMVCR